ncbi:MAG: MerR family transcriptional regulator [Pirellulales bacterium]
MPKLDEYLRITEAAEYVGVAPNTLRNWGKSGKLTERRHPMNGYRLYDRDELDKLLRMVNGSPIRKPVKKTPK